MLGKLWIKLEKQAATQPRTTVMPQNWNGENTAAGMLLALSGGDSCFQAGLRDSCIREVQIPVGENCSPQDLALQGLHWPLDFLTTASVP